MPRQNRRRDDAPVRPPTGGSLERLTWHGQDYLVRRVAGGAGAKLYRCPGCDQELPSGLPHVVAWPENESGADDRRHWHASCWSARDTRRPTRR
ncbi:hypothetical protein [Jatrophihabitans sp.]|uniref:hypothetical protein n=1 Tax=Jatrophihabitans sp. TaxID=1932789 RepID=UPI0030C6AA1D